MPGETVVKPYLVSMCLSACVTLACDEPKSESKPDPAAQQADEDAELDARLEKRKQERLAAQEAEETEKAEIEAKIEEITVIPDGAELPKKLPQACEQVVEAQRGFMKKFHPDIDDAALTTQLGMLAKQCNEMATVEIAMCQKYALDATTELLKGAINEYLPACMKKYPKT